MRISPHAQFLPSLSFWPFSSGMSTSSSPFPTPTNASKVLLSLFFSIAGQMEEHPTFVSPGQSPEQATLPPVTLAPLRSLLSASCQQKYIATARDIPLCSFICKFRASRSLSLSFSPRSSRLENSCARGKFSSTPGPAEAVAISGHLLSANKNRRP